MKVKKGKSTSELPGIITLNVFSLLKYEQLLVPKSNNALSGRHFIIYSFSVPARNAKIADTVFLHLGNNQAVYWANEIWIHINTIDSC